MTNLTEKNRTDSRSDPESGGVRTGVQLLTVPEHAHEQRLDNFLSSRLPGLPRSHLYRLIRKGEIRINKGRCKPDTRVMTGDVVRVAPLRLAQRGNIVAPGAGLQKTLTDSVLFEDEQMIIINKPAGLAVHTGTGSPTGVIEVLRYMAGEGSYRELVHRLDKETSGCLMVAKTGNTLKSLQDDLKHKRIQKTYLAIVHGQWPASLDRVNAALRKFQPHEGERIVKTDGKQGKPSETRFEVQETFANASLIKAMPLTGRTHQIRVHCQTAGHPIIGDNKYTYHAQHAFQAVSFLNLHASQLVFNHPVSHQSMTIAAPLRGEMQELLRSLREKAAGKR